MQSLWGTLDFIFSVGYQYSKLCTSSPSRATMATAPYNYSYIFKYIIIGKWAALDPCLASGHWQGSGLISLSFFAFVGDMGVGKSCLLHQFTEKKCKCCLDFSVFLSYLCMHAFLCVKGCQVQPEFLNHFKFFIRQWKSVAQKRKLDSVSQLQPPITIQLPFCLASLLTRQILCAWSTRSHITSCTRTHAHTHTHTHTHTKGCFRRRPLVWDEFLLQHLWG